MTESISPPISCPVCETPLTHDNSKKNDLSPPFCSRRCRMIDLGRWLREEYRILRPATLEDLAESPPDLAGPVAE